MKRASSALEAFSEELKREAKSRNSQHSRDVYKLQALSREAESMLALVENAKWSLEQPETVSQIDEALKSGWETTIRKYEQLVDRIRFGARELKEPLPTFLQAAKSTEKRVIAELQMPYNVSYLRPANYLNRNYWTQDVNASEQAICVPPDSRLATRLRTLLDPVLSDKLQADSKLLSLGDITYSDYVKRFRAILATVDWY
jgi:hypothetical protein